MVKFKSFFGCDPMGVNSKPCLQHKRNSVNFKVFFGFQDRLKISVEQPSEPESEFEQSVFENLTRITMRILTPEILHNRQQPIDNFFLNILTGRCDVYYIKFHVDVHHGYIFNLNFVLPIKPMTIGLANVRTANHVISGNPLKIPWVCSFQSFVGIFLM